MSETPDEMLDVDDIQGIVLRGHGNLTGARFLLLRVVDAHEARAYLQTLHTRITRANERPETFALQIAFTASGLLALGLHANVLATFSREFIEGMDQSDRATALGDRDANDPSTWRWGHQAKHAGAHENTDALEQRRVDAMLMVYALDELVGTHVATELREMRRGFALVEDQDTITLADHKEHFGWRDGLSMPKMTGVPPRPPPPVPSVSLAAPLPDDPDQPDEPADPAKKREWWTSAIPAGEFVLGYRNDYKIYTESPTAELVDDPENLLPIAPDGIKKSVGRNGTYLVYRQMTQDVHAFWDYLQKHSREQGDDAESRAIALGAKMVGRWPNGAPLITSPTDDPARAKDNKFMYLADKGGLVCPNGAHIRRASPRDVLAVDDRDPEAAVLMVRKHQMVRRGRSFGPPVDEEMRPHAIMAAPRDNKPRGLHFICLVGDINRQFEFVQRAWIHSGTFDSMYKDGDPISGGRAAPNSENPNDEFTCPAAPVRRKYKAMPQFSTLVGGAYFFLPGLRALRFIARHPGPVGVP